MSLDFEIDSRIIDHNISRLEIVLTSEKRPARGVRARVEFSQMNSGEMVIPDHQNLAAGQRIMYMRDNKVWMSDVIDIHNFLGIGFDFIVIHKESSQIEIDLQGEDTDLIAIKKRFSPVSRGYELTDVQKSQRPGRSNP